MNSKVTELDKLQGWELRQLIESFANQKDLPLETYHQQIQAVLDEMNRRGREIASKHKKRFYPYQLRDFSKRFFEEEK